MKHWPLFLFMLISSNAFALYGSKVTASHANFVGSVESQDMSCSAVLVSPRKVLTAGHCIDMIGRILYKYSHGLIYRPELLKAKFKGRTYTATSVTLAPNYFEGTGYDTEDLALVELDQDVKDVTPVKLALKSSLLVGMDIRLISHHQEVKTKLASLTTYPETTVLWLGQEAGVCRGDSGGAVVIQDADGPRLAGILVFDSEEQCQRKKGRAYFPRMDF